MPIHKPSLGTPHLVKPPKTLTIDLTKLLDILAQMEKANITYKLDTKASFSTPVAKIKTIDCSGFIRYVTYYASNGTIKMPDGSWHQDDWCKAQGLQVQDYKTHGSLTDNKLRIAFKHGGGVGHVWYVLNGQTIESHGKHHGDPSEGPDRRAWNTGYFNPVAKCYQVT